MRTLILTLLLFAGIQSQAQEDIFSYELNIGVSQTNDWFEYFPGMSYLVGITRITRSNKVFEAQVGLAAPYPITGRIGTGIYIEDANTTITVGVRPLPAHAYVQLQWLPLNKSYGFTMSYEESAFSLLKSEPNYSVEPSLFDIEALSGNSFRILTVGYKWNIGSKFGRR
jgi:hypothetical protein